jgi:hypothetical protein
MPAIKKGTFKDKSDVENMIDERVNAVLKNEFSSVTSITNLISASCPRQNNLKLLRLFC